jgi:hypothetical protein
MEGTLVIVTLLSLGLAIAMAIVAWRVKQEERQRAAARVAALEEGLAASLAANPGASWASADTPHPGALPSFAAAKGDLREAGRTGSAGSLGAEIVSLQDTGEHDWLAQFPPSTSTKVNGTSHVNGTRHNGVDQTSGQAVTQPIDLRLHEESDVPTQPIAVDRLFADASASASTSARSRGLLAIGLGGAVIMLLILAVWSVGRLTAPGVGADSRGAAGVKPTTNATAPLTAGAPLELVGLEQTRQADQLTIHGTVRNPSGGVMIDGLAVVVAFFDASGQQLSSVRAPLDFRSLAPGDESPFQVTTAVPSGVTRYRVSFRRDDGTIVPHVDRRQQEAS